MNNIMQLMQLMTQLKGSNNPMNMMEQMFGNDTAFTQAKNMAANKNPQEMQKMVENLCKQKGIDFNQAKNMLGQMGFKL